jgi:hypothetical protein
MGHDDHWRRGGTRNGDIANCIGLAFQALGQHDEAVRAFYASKKSGIAFGYRA